MAEHEYNYRGKSASSQSFENIRRIYGVARSAKYVHVLR